jgi:hypothetical protein
MKYYYPSEIKRKQNADWDREYTQACLQEMSDAKIMWLAEECSRINSYRNRRER